MHMNMKILFYFLHNFITATIFQNCGCDVKIFLCNCVGLEMTLDTVLPSAITRHGRQRHYLKNIYLWPRNLRWSRICVDFDCLVVLFVLILQGTFQNYVKVKQLTLTLNGSL